MLTWLDGITRELYALLGDNPPPVAIVEKKFKERPRWMGKANPWYGYLVQLL